MKVGFNALLLRSGKIRGWNRYTLNLLRSLQDLGLDIFLYSRFPIDGENLKKLHPESVNTRWAHSGSYFLWEQGWLPQKLKSDKVDLFHSPFHFGLPLLSPCPKVMTLHDAHDQVNPAVWRTWRERLLHARSSFLQWHSRNFADHILTVSDFSRKEIIATLKIPAHKVTRIYESFDPQFTRTRSDQEDLQVRQKYNLKRPYFFYLGGFDQRKNLPFLLDVFEATKNSGVELVLAGGGPEQEAMQSRWDSGSDIRFLGYVEETDLSALYAGAKVFINPSLYEGFGLQICEAMVTGCPVFAADNTCLPEILGDAGALFDPADKASLAGLLERASHDDSWLQQLSEKGLRRAEFFSWKKAAEETLKVYQSLC